MHKFTAHEFNAGFKAAQYMIAVFGIEKARQRAREVYNGADMESQGFVNAVESYKG